MSRTANAALVAQSGVVIPEPKYRVTLSIALDWGARNRVLPEHIARDERHRLVQRFARHIAALKEQLEEPGYAFGVDDPDLFGSEGSGLTDDLAETLILRYLEHLYDGGGLEALTEDFTAWLMGEAQA